MLRNWASIRPFVPPLSGSNPIPYDEVTFYCPLPPPDSPNFVWLWKWTLCSAKAVDVITLTLRQATKATRLQGSLKPGLTSTSVVPSK